MKPLLSKRRSPKVVPVISSSWIKIGFSISLRMHYTASLQSKSDLCVHRSRMELATLTGRGESTVYRWLKLYKAGGLQTMLEIPTSPGKPPWLVEKPSKSWKLVWLNREALKAYGAIQQWLLDECELEVPYKTVHQTVHYRLQPSSRFLDRDRVRRMKPNNKPIKKTAPSDWGDDHSFCSGTARAVLVHGWKSLGTQDPHGSGSNVVWC